MKKFILLFLLFSIPLQAQTSLNSTTFIRKSYDSEKLTIDSTAGGIGFTSSKINPTCVSCSPGTSRASAASCTLETADIRIQTSGVTITSSTGMYITSGQAFVIYGYNDIAAFKGIRITATSGVINCTYYR